MAVRTSLLRLLCDESVGVSKKLMRWSLPLPSNSYISIMCAYAPTLVAEEHVKDQFYDLLDRTINNVPRTDKFAILGDFNARVGTGHQLWHGVLGSHGVGSCNANDLRLLTFCSEHSLTITNARFQLRNIHKTTWQHARSKDWHLLDYVLVRQCDFGDVRITRVIRGAEAATDHMLVRTKL